MSQNCQFLTLCSTLTTGKRLATHRIVLAVLAEHLRRNPALGARHAGPSAEAVAAHRQLLAQAEVGDHGFDAAVGVGHGHQDVVGLQVSVDWGRDGRIG